MTSELSRLKNIGPRTAAWLNDIGIHTREELAGIGVVEAYKRLKVQGYTITLVGVYALQGALMDCHWNALPEEVKTALQEEVAHFLATFRARRR